MAIKRTSSNSISNAVKLSTGFSSAAIPNSPTIGAATATSDVAATVEYTAAVLGATASTFTATSNPGSVTGTGSSPITVTGLTASTSYTFSVTAGNANGTSAASSASNSITTSAPSGSYESIATATVGAAGAANIEFTSIPATYTHLQIRFMCLHSSSNAQDLKMNFNSDTASNYSGHALYGDGSSAAAYGNTSTTKIRPGVNGAGNGTYPTMFSVGIIDILDYANTNKYKTTRTLNGFDTNNATNNINNHTIGFTSGNWRSTSAITSIVLAPEPAVNFIQYSQFSLYGIKGA